jgi:hypothetical protein
MLKYDNYYVIFIFGSCKRRLPYALMCNTDTTKRRAYVINASFGKSEFDSLVGS